MYCRSSGDDRTRSNRVAGLLVMDHAQIVLPYHPRGSLEDLLVRGPRLEIVHKHPKRGVRYGVNPFGDPKRRLVDEERRHREPLVPHWAEVDLPKEGASVPEGDLLHSAEPRRVEIVVGVLLGGVSHVAVDDLFVAGATLFGQLSPWVWVGERTARLGKANSEEVEHLRDVTRRRNLDVTWE